MHTLAVLLILSERKLYRLLQQKAEISRRIRANTKCW